MLGGWGARQVRPVKPSRAGWVGCQAGEANQAILYVRPSCAGGGGCAPVRRGVVRLSGEAGRPPCGGSGASVRRGRSGHHVHS